MGPRLAPAHRQERRTPRTRARRHQAAFDHQRLAGDIKREASSSEVTDLKKENDQLKRLLADIMLKNDVLKKSVLGLESTWADE